MPALERYCRPSPCPSVFGLPRLRSHPTCIAVAEGDSPHLGLAPEGAGAMVEHRWWADRLDRMKVRESALHTLRRQGTQSHVALAVVWPSPPRPSQLKRFGVIHAS